MMVKDEADIIGYTLPRLAAQVDFVIVADNLSTDQTPAILREVADRFGNIELVCDDDPAYTQSQKMTALAGRAGRMGAEWVVPVDADEVWCYPGLLRDYLPLLEGIDVAAADLYDHVVTGADSDDPDPIRRIAYRRREKGSPPKVACRVRPGLVIEQGNHGAHYPGRHVGAVSNMHVRHFPYRSAEQMTRKARNGAAAYRAAEGRTPPGAGRHWTDYDRFYQEGGQAAITEIFETWFYEQVPSEALILDPCPV